MDESQMRRRCPTALLKGMAVLNDYAFLINSRSVATILPRPGRVVYGLLWQLKPSDEKSLDRYEGVSGGFYRKEQVRVIGKAGVEIAFAYVAADSEPGRGPWPYLARILGAARTHSFPKPYLAEIEEWNTTNS